MPTDEDRAYLESIPDDEPVLIFRAQDRYALRAASGWADAAVAGGLVKEEKVDRMIENADRVQAWQMENEHKVKAPD